MRTDGGDANSAPRAARSESDSSGKYRKDPPDAKMAQRFRMLLQGNEGVKTGQGRDVERFKKATEGRDGLWSAAALAHMQAQHTPAAPGVAVAHATSSGAAPQAALAELLERHVRHILASEQAHRAEPGSQIMLRLSDTALAGTDLWLTRGYGGWTLRADASDAEAASLIREFAPHLVSRFKQRNLGPLKVQIGTRG